MKTLVIIPSRLSATRLPGKPLLKINGVSIISHVYKRAEKARTKDSKRPAVLEQRRDGQRPNKMERIPNCHSKCHVLSQPAGVSQVHDSRCGAGTRNPSKGGHVQRSPKLNKETQMEATAKSSKTWKEGAHVIGRGACL